ALATVRVNGRDNGDTTDSGFPVGTFYGITYFNADFGQGQSYKMLDGSYSPGGDGAQDLQMGMAGMANISSPHTSDGEASFSVGAAFFPFVQKWIGAHVLGSAASIGPNGEASFDSDAYSPILK